MKKMKKLKKLSLENEMKKEAEQIEKKVREDKSLDDITVSDEMEKELFNKIQDYEYDKRHKKVVRKKKKSKLVIGALAAVLILVCGSVMTSVGSKSYWKTLWNDSNGDEQNNGIDVENMESIETEDIDEVGVYKEIAKVMGNYLVRIEYKPEDMALKKYSVDQNQRRANLFYQNEKDGKWHQIDAYSKKIENDYYVAASKSIQVDRGYYYRVHADHFVRMGEEPIEETFSYTNGILVP